MHLDIGPKNSEANRSERIMDTCQGEGGAWDEMCEHVRGRILTMPDDEFDVGKNTLSHCEHGRLNHKNDGEFKCTTVVLRQMIAHESLPNGNFMGSRERRFLTCSDHCTFTDGDFLLWSHFVVGFGAACHGCICASMSDQSIVC